MLALTAEIAEIWVHGVGCWLSRQLKSVPPNSTAISQLQHEYLIRRALSSLQPTSTTPCRNLYSQDEMKALQRLNTAYFLIGYLGFLATWIMDLIDAVIHPGL